MTLKDGWEPGFVLYCLCGAWKSIDILKQGSFQNCTLPTYLGRRLTEALPLNTILRKAKDLERTYKILETKLLPSDD